MNNFSSSSLFVAAFMLSFFFFILKISLLDILHRFGGRGAFTQRYLDDVIAAVKAPHVFRRRSVLDIQHWRYWLIVFGGRD